MENTENLALVAVNEFIKKTSNLLKDHKLKLIDIYKEYVTFKEPKSNEWETDFKINKAKEIIEKSLPKVISKDPKWIVSGRGVDYNQEQVDAIQDYLFYIFDEYNLSDNIKLWVKAMLIYGYSFAKIEYKIETDNVTEINKNGKAIIKKEIIGEYPTIKVLSFMDMFFDPRYRTSEDMPAIAEQSTNIRISDLLKDKKYSKSKIAGLGMAMVANSEEEYKNAITSINHIPVVSFEDFDKQKITITKYYGVFSPTGEAKDEKNYEIHIANGAVVLYMREIINKPYVDIQCFPDPEVYFATGIIEPMLGLQKELNYKKKLASIYINNALNRSYVWSPYSGINPANLISRPNNIIPTTKTGQEAMANLYEIPQRTLDSSYFQEQNDIERQIQSATFTIDTSNSRGQQALTDTATGAKIKNFENNIVINEIRKSFEKGLEKIAYKLLQSSFENIGMNIVFKKTDTEDYWEMNKEALRNAVKKYAIKIESNSTSYDYMEDRRAENIAFFNMLLRGVEAGAVDETGIKEALKEILGTFEKKQPERFLKKVDIDQVMGNQQQPQGQNVKQVKESELARPQQEFDLEKQLQDKTLQP